ELDLVERYVAWPFNHHLDPFAPRSLGQLSQRRQLAKLRLIGRDREPVRSKTITNRKAHVIPTHHIADLIPQLVHRVFRIVYEHPLGQQRPTATDNADESVPDVFEMPPPHTRVDGEVVHALLRL